MTCLHFGRRIMLVLLLLSFWAGGTLRAQQAYKEIHEGEYAPDFAAKDIGGNTHSLKAYQGKKILLSFYRYAACPVCNYRFHEVEEHKSFFDSNDIVVLSVYESSPENLKKLLDTNQFFQYLIPDPRGLLYDLYGVEVNKSKTAKGLLHGAKQKGQKGKTYFSQPIDKDGNTHRIAADFLIDEKGHILVAYYGKYLGDRLPIEEIRKILNKQ